MPRCKLDVRTRALTVMFDVMKAYGSHFQPAWWKDLFQVIFRIFDDKKLQSIVSEQEKSEWLNSTCTGALRFVIDVLTQYFDVLQDVLLEDVLLVLKWALRVDSEQLVLASMPSDSRPTTCLQWRRRRVLARAHHQQRRQVHSHVVGHGRQHHWEHVRGDAAERTAGIPRARPGQPGDKAGALRLRHIQPASEQRQSEFDRAIIKCRAQLELIHTVEWITLAHANLPAIVSPAKPSDGAPALCDSRWLLHSVPCFCCSNREVAKAAALDKPVDSAGQLFRFISSDHLMYLVECLFASNKFARAFNDDVDLRTMLWKAGYTKQRSRPNLMKQETTSLGRAHVSF